MLAEHHPWTSPRSFIACWLLDHDIFARFATVERCVSSVHPGQQHWVGFDWLSSNIGWRSSFTSPALIFKGFEEQDECLRGYLDETWSVFHVITTKKLSQNRQANNGKKHKVLFALQSPSKYGTNTCTKYFPFSIHGLFSHLRFYV